MTADTKAWAAYFQARPAYRRVLLALRQKYRRCGYPAGTVRLDDAREEECDALRAIFGRPFSPPVRFRSAEFEDALRKLKYPDCSLKEILEVYFGEEIQTNQERRQLRNGQFSRLLHTAAQETGSETCRRWLRAAEEKQGSGYLLLLRSPEQAQNALRLACRSVEWLEQNNGQQLRLAVLAAQATTDPHALDGNTLCGKLFLHLLAARTEQPYPENAEQRDALYFRNGILCDSISSTVAQVGLTLNTEAGEHSGYALLRENCEICTLSLANLSRLTAAYSRSGRVYLVENEMVFSQLCDQAGRFHSPLVCTSGQPSVAALRLLDLLAAGGADLYYSGDFDGRGLSIALQLLVRYPDRLQLWHMAPEDYARSRSETPLGEGSAALLRCCEGTALAETAGAIARHRRAGYQELLLAELEMDLTEAV